MCFYFAAHLIFNKMKTIAKALKEKNKIKNEIANLQKKLNSHNSILKGNKRPVDLQAVESELIEKIDLLVSLKNAITKANQPVQERIYKLAELRGLISFYRNLPVTEGLHRSSYGNEPFAYEVFFNEAVIDERVKKLDSEAEKLQDELEVFNHKTYL